MPIKVRYFASLKENLGRAEDKLDIKQAATVKAAWSVLNPDKALPDNTLAAINMEYVTLDATLHEGDELAFFPPVTGG